MAKLCSSSGRRLGGTLDNRRLIRTGETQWLKGMRRLQRLTRNHLANQVVGSELIPDLEVLSHEIFKLVQLVPEVRLGLRKLGQILGSSTNLAGSTQ